MKNRKLKTWVVYSLCALGGIALAFGLVAVWLQPAPITCNKHHVCHRDY